jgi:hypothetical protein
MAGVERASFATRGKLIDAVCRFSGAWFNPIIDERPVSFF